jgi:hypothetical protein
MRNLDLSSIAHAGSRHVGPCELMDPAGQRDEEKPQGMGQRAWPAGDQTRGCKVPGAVNVTLNQTGTSETSIELLDSTRSRTD